MHVLIQWSQPSVMVEVLGKNMVTEVGENVYYKDRKGVPVARKYFRK